MKKNLLLIWVALLVVAPIRAQKNVGSYYNSYFDKSYSVEASLDTGELRVYFDVEGSSHSDSVCFFIKGEDNLNAFEAALLSAKAKYTEWVEVAVNNNVTQMTKDMGISFPRVTVCWYGSQWWFDYNHPISPYFIITDSGQHVCVFRGEATASSNEYIDQKYYLALASVEDFDNLYAALRSQTIIDKLNSEKRVEDLFQ